MPDEKSIVVSVAGVRCYRLFAATLDADSLPKKRRRAVLKVAFANDKKNEVLSQKSTYVCEILRQFSYL
ncbi:MAG TPA: hypothetical protein DHU79_08365 [Clostridiales bacterium]|nr:hypothetical protein [Clostridiales bacterium]